MGNGRRGSRKNDGRERFPSSPSERFYQATFPNEVQPVRYLNQSMRPRGSFAQPRGHNGGVNGNRILSAPPNLQNRRDDNHRSRVGAHNPVVANRVRNLKSQSEVLKRELQKMVDNVDALQPDPDDMDWAASAGTVVYMPASSTDHPEVVGPNCGFYPSPTRPCLPHKGCPRQGPCKVCPQASGALPAVDSITSAPGSVQTAGNTWRERQVVDLDEETAAAAAAAQEQGVHVVGWKEQWRTGPLDGGRISRSCGQCQPEL